MQTKSRQHRKNKTKVIFLAIETPLQVIYGHVQLPILASQPSAGFYLEATPHFPFSVHSLLH